MSVSAGFILVLEGYGSRCFERVLGGPPPTDGAQGSRLEGMRWLDGFG